MNIKYRPEIDGLRAVAVVIVIFYHAQLTILGFQPFQGGFIGVDIFFVISGYLITSIILKELITTGKFSYLYFYERRIRRILPALLLVMLISLPFAWIHLLPSEFIDFSKSILYSLGFGSNFYFHYSGQEYGTESGLLKPFLHTWSLSVEEQFYIIFPFVLLVVFKFFKKYLTIILITGFIASLAMADWGSKNYSSSTFYLLHTRMWELLAGSILAYYEIKLAGRNKNKLLGLILPSFGFLLILYSIIFFNDKMFHPSFYTLSPIIGVCLIVWFSNKNEPVTKMLSTKIFVGIGLISYSLYLWHYPIFAFARIAEFFNTSIFNNVLIGLIIFLLSIISYFCVERTARNKKYKFKLIISFVLLSLIVLMIANLSIIKKDGYVKRLPLILQQNLSKDHSILFNKIRNKDCHNIKDRCVFNSKSNKKIFIVGDSHLEYFFLHLKDKVVDKDYSLTVSTYDNNIYFPGFVFAGKKTNTLDLKSYNFNSDFEENLKNQKNSIIILGGRFPLYFTNYRFDNKEGGVEGKEWEDQFISNNKFGTIQDSFKISVDELSKNNKIILIYPIPEAGWNVPKKLFNKLPKKSDEVKKYIKNNLVPKEYITTSYKVYKERTNSSFEVLDSITGGNIYRVYPHKFLCNNLIKDRCITHDNENIFYRDSHHLSIKGAEKISNLIIKEIDKIQLKSN